MKRKKQKPKYKDIEFDSIDEIEFYKWCEQAVEANVIHDFTYHPPTMQILPAMKYFEEVQLKTKTKVVQKHLLNGVEYTGDFIVTAYADAPLKGLKQINIHSSGDFTIEYLIDVKGSFQLYHDGKYFSLLQKIVFDKMGYYINKVILKKFFKVNGKPILRTEKTGKVSLKYKECPSIKEVRK